MNESAMQSIRVLDFSWLLAGPYATRLLADFGAEVIKVQSRKTANGAEDNNSGYFNMWNRNKLSVTLDMTHPESRELVLKLAKISDVVVENFTPRVMENWGLDYEALREVKPDLIMVSLRGMGKMGPWRDYAALGQTIQALSGITYLTSYEPEQPVGTGYAHVDSVAGVWAAFITLAALEHRRATGQGQYIDISEYEVMCSLLGPILLEYSVNNNSAQPAGNTNQYLPAAHHDCYQCHGDDRWCVIVVSDEEEWQALCQVMSNPAWSRQKKFSTSILRQKNKEELDKLINQWTANYTAEQVTAMLQKAGVPSAVVNNAEDLANDPQLKSRGFFIQLPHPVLGNTVSDATPIKLSRTPARYSRAAPRLGQDNRYVFHELLGLSEAKIQQYIDRGIIA